MADRRFLDAPIDKMGREILDQARREFSPAEFANIMEVLTHTVFASINQLPPILERSSGGDPDETVSAMAKKHNISLEQASEIAKSVFQDLLLMAEKNRENGKSLVSSFFELSSVSQGIIEILALIRYNLKQLGRKVLLLEDDKASLEKANCELRDCVRGAEMFTCSPAFISSGLPLVLGEAWSSGKPVSLIGLDIQNLQEFSAESIDVDLRASAGEAYKQFLSFLEYQIEEQNSRSAGIKAELLPFGGDDRFLMLLKGTDLKTVFLFAFKMRDVLNSSSFRERVLQKVGFRFGVAVEGFLQDLLKGFWRMDVSSNKIYLALLADTLITQLQESLDSLRQADLSESVGFGGRRVFLPDIFDPKQLAQLGTDHTRGILGSVANRRKQLADEVAICDGDTMPWKGLPD